MKNNNNAALFLMLCCVCFAGSSASAAGTIQGELRFTNTNAALVHSLNLEGFSHAVVTAESMAGTEYGRYSVLAEASSATRILYNLSVGALAAEDTYRMTAEAIFNNGNKRFKYPAITLPAGVPSEGSFTQNMTYCASLVDVRFLDHNTPKAMSGGYMKAYKETAPGSGQYWEQAVAPFIPYGATQQYLPIIGDGSLYRFDVYWQTGDDAYSDTMTHRCRTLIQSQCDRIIQVNCEISQPQQYGSISGALDVIDGTVHNIQEWSRVTAWKGPLDNERFTHVPGTGAYQMGLLAPSNAESPEKPYRVYAELLMGQAPYVQYLRTPELGVGDNPGVSVGLANVDLGNTFVMGLGKVRGELRLKGPESDSPQVFWAMLQRDQDTDQDGLPDDIMVLNSHVFATGSNTLAEGATHSAAGGLVRAMFEGAYDADAGVYRADYQMGLVGLEGKAAVWRPNGIHLNFEQIDDERYLSNSITVENQLIGNAVIAPGQGIELDQQYCLGDVRMALYHDSPFYRPTITGSGQYAGTDAWGDVAEYRVTVDAARGLPLTMGNAYQGSVRLLLPAGHYQLTPQVFVPIEGTNSELQTLPVVDVDVACSEVQQLSNRLALTLDTLTEQTQEPEIILRGHVISRFDVTSVAYRVNAGETVMVCQDCGQNPNFEAVVSLNEGDNLIVVTATDSAGDITEKRLRVQYTPVEPPPPPVEPLALKGCYDQQIAVPYQSDGAIVPLQVTAYQGCADAVVQCNGQYADFYAVGTTSVQCHAYDSCGMQASCDFSITVTEQDPPACEGEAAKPVVTSDVNDTLLWPPNKQWVDVGLVVKAEAPCAPDTDPFIRTQVWSNEPANGKGKWFDHDWWPLKHKTLLRAERDGKGDGRVYLLITQVKGNSGQLSTVCDTVVVPKSASSKHKALVAAQAASAKAYCEANGAAPGAYYALKAKSFKWMKRGWR